MVGLQRQKYTIQKDAFSDGFIGFISSSLFAITVGLTERYSKAICNIHDGAFCLDLMIRPLTYML